MRLKSIREDRDITQTEIAKLLNCKQNTYQQYESGKRQVPIEALIKLSKFYKTSVDYLLEVTDDPTPYSVSKKNSDFLSTNK